MSDDLPAVAPVAHIYGKPVLKVPSDLFIPPDALEVFLESFDGPLDLLLYLIRKDNFDILDIPMAELTQQYLAYIDLIQKNRFELAAEYLLMAAMLIDIKVRMLLPKPVKEAEEEEDPRAELVRRLMEYQRIQTVAKALSVHPCRDVDYWVAHVPAPPVKRAPVLPPLTLEVLQEACKRLLNHSMVTQKHQITREELSVRSYMVAILKQLSSDAYIRFSDLFETRDANPKKAIIVIHFLALLELAKEQHIDIIQAEPGASIFLKRLTLEDTLADDIESES